MSRITEDEWYTVYKPVKNPINLDANWWTSEAGGGILFEAQGQDLEYVISQIDTNKVWSLIDDGDNRTVCAGYSLVNREGYFITENPWTDLSDHWVVWDSSLCSECDETEDSCECKNA